MAEFEHNDELAQFRRWWTKNGAATVIGVLIAAVAIGGWYGWQWYQHRQDHHAADLFAKVQHAIATDNMTGGVQHIVKSLKQQYAGTPYAGAAALIMANYEVGKNKLSEAEQQLDWAMKHAEGKGVRTIATVRKARVLWAENKPDAALSLLKQDHPAAFDALFEEVTGDIQDARGNQSAAHQSYAKALDHLPPDAPKGMLQQKLKQTAPANSSGDSTDSTQADS